MKESDIEACLVQGVKRVGGRAYKFVSPGNSGVPDRLVVLPGGRIEFVELKTETGRLSKLQLHQIRQLNALGCATYTLYGRDDVLAYLRDCERRLRNEI